MDKRTCLVHPDASHNSCVVCRREAETDRDAALLNHADALLNYADAREECKRLWAELKAVLASSVEHDDPRIGYLTIQVDRITWLEAHKVLECSKKSKVMED